MKDPNETSTGTAVPTNEHEATADQIAAWKRAHPKVYRLEAGEMDTPPELKGRPFYVRKPTRAEMGRLMRDVSKDPQGTISNLLLEITLRPNRVELGELFERYPGLPGGLQVGMQELLGIGLDFSAREL